MSDDDNTTQPVQFEEIELSDEDELYDATDLLEYLGNVDEDEIEQATRPFMKALVEVTRQHDIPADLLWKSMRPDEGWIACDAMVGRNGLLRISAEAYDKLVPGERVEVRVRRLPSNIDDED